MLQSWEGFAGPQRQPSEALKHETLASTKRQCINLLSDLTGDTNTSDACSFMLEIGFNESNAYI